MMHVDSVVSGLAGLVAPDARLERVATGASWSEGPLWMPRRRSLRFSDIPGNRILEYSEDTGATSVYRDDVEFTNGRTLDEDGSVIQCSHGLRRIERDADGVVTSVVDNWRGIRFNSPNDVIVARDGQVWFTDPAYGITKPEEGHPGEREYGDHYVFRHDPSAGTTDAVIVDMEQPNGLAFSPDESILYVSNSSSIRYDPDVGTNHIRAYDVTGGRCKNGRVLATVDEGVPDGIRVDLDGNVWSSSETAVQVFDAAGRTIGRIPVPETVGNLCFGGEDGTTLYIAATTSIYRIATFVRDAACA